MCTDFFKTLFGYYRIRTESRLKKAAAKGGCEWELAKDVTVTTDIAVTAAQALMINGKGHCIARMNGDRQSPIIVVGDHADLYIRNVRMINTVGRCFCVHARAKLCVDACALQSAGDGIVNYAKTWVYGGTTMRSSQIGKVCIRNMRTNENEIGEVVLYKCAIDFLYNEGVLTLMRSDSQIGGVISKRGSKIIMI